MKEEKQIRAKFSKKARHLSEAEMINGFEYKFYRFLQRRKKKFNVDFRDFSVPCQKDLVSVILPVYNGEELIVNSIESILRQTYRNFELIIVDDGSTDGSPAIIDAYAKKDQRITVIHKKNGKLPRALNTGFENANGEFLTWTSDDNVMHPDFLKKLVAYMKKHPGLGMCYANLRVIDKDGNPITDNKWYPGRENTENVYLPDALLRLNTYPENSIAAAFMYRRAIPELIGGYSPLLYTVEDYDYWMRINDFFSIKHTDFDEPIYDYRFHNKSLTARAESLGINKIRDNLMLIEDYREDWLIRPMCWISDCGELPQQWQSFVKEVGDITMSPEIASEYIWPDMGTGVVQLVFTDGQTETVQTPHLTKDSLRVLVCRESVPPKPKEEDFDLKIQISDIVPHLEKGWIHARDDRTAFDLIQIFCKSRWFEMFMETNRSGKAPAIEASIILCTYKRLDLAEQAIGAMLAQTGMDSKYEILVVNNDPSNREMYQIATEAAKGSMVPVRYIDCPYPGLSAARNASIYAAEGQFLLYVDDDGIMNPDCLMLLNRAFTNHPEAGVIGGEIILNKPERFADVILPGYESLWSERRYTQTEYFNVEYDYDFPYGCNFAIRRNILREMGGFRVSYGRVGKDFAGGEEIVLSYLVQKAGMKIGVEPAAKIIHDVEPSRYTLEHVKNSLRASKLTNQLMKLDLYRNIDFYMTEEKYQLERAKEKLKALKERNVPDDDLELLYCQYDMEATEAAIQRGHEYMRERKEASLEYGTTKQYLPASAENPVYQGGANRFVCAIFLLFAKLFAKTSLGAKFSSFAADIKYLGIHLAFKNHFEYKKERLQKRKKKKHPELERLKQMENEIQKLCDYQRGTKDCIYDFEQRLNKQLRNDKINQLRRVKKILLVGTGEHKNIGDAAITVAEQEILLELYPEYELVEFSTFEMEEKYAFLQAILNRQDVFVISGGGNLGSLYPAEEALHQKIVQDFPDHKVIILPQSILYEEDENGKILLDQAEKIYNRHPNLTIMTRGNQSFSFAKEHFNHAEIVEFPDMVLSIRKHYQFDRHGVLLCMRQDKEKAISDETYDAILAAAENYFEKVDTTTNMHKDLITRDIRAAVVNNQLKEFARHQLVITDRLHGMIFAAITGTPVIVFPSKDHKIEECYHSYLQANNLIYFMPDQQDTLSVTIEQLLSKEMHTFLMLPENFSEEFKKICRLS